MTLQYLYFTVLAVLAVASALVTITNKNPVASAVALIFHFFMLAGLYLTLQAQFVAVVQVLVYAGAIMVLVVFVIMLLNLGKEMELQSEGFDTRKIVAGLFAAVLVVEFLAVYMSVSLHKDFITEHSVEQGTIEAIGKTLFTNYLVPIQAIGILLLAAIVGAVILAKRRLD